jgi:flagellar basal-body rod protein FlgG
MTLSIDAALSGMLEHQHKIEMISNNIANVNTTGYKRVSVHFQALLDTAEILHAAQGTLPVQQATTAGGVETSSIDRVFEQGTLQTSESPFDFAIAGPGLFKVALEDGSAAYTRDGALHVDGNRQLVMSDGTRLDPPMTLPEVFTGLTVDNTGMLIASRPMTAAELAARAPADLTTTTAVEVGRFTLARFDNPESLAVIGNNLYRPTAASGPAVEGAPGEPGFGEVVDHRLEASNVDMGTELTGMIVASRSFQMNLQAYRTISEMLRQAGELPA